MRLLGAILAGGQSRRFGSDKAEAQFRGKALLDHVADALRPQCAELVVAARDWPGITPVADYPEPLLGPLGGLAGAFNYAYQNGFDGILSSGCDIVGLPGDLALQLGVGPAILADIPVVGLWPVGLYEALTSWLQHPGNRSVYRFADHVGARRVATPKGLINANRPGDLG